MKSISTVILLCTLMRACIATALHSTIDCQPCICTVDVKREATNMNCTGLGITEDELKTILPPSKINRTEINLDNNSISRITESTLSIYKSYRIIGLSFRNNSLVYVSRNAFGGMEYLTELTLSDNVVDESVLQQSFYGVAKTPLETLNISSMGLNNTSDEFFKAFEKTKHLSVIFMNNTDNIFPSRQFQSMRFLSGLHFGENQLNRFDKQNTTFQRLTYLNLDNNYLTLIPRFCSGNSSMFPMLKVLSIQWNRMRFLHRERYECLNQLTHLYLNGNNFDALVSNQFANLPSLYKITLSYVGCGKSRVEPAVFNNSALRQIFFRENHIWFRREEVSLRIFEGCSNLTLLNLNDNIFTVTTEDEFSLLLKDLTNLQVLVMGSCSLNSIPKVITEKLVHLESLALYGNGITDIKEHTFDKLVNLKKLFMSFNKITTIGPNSLPVRFVKQAIKVDFSYNPFSCTCELMWFVNWLKLNRKVFNPSRNAYPCSEPYERRGQLLLDLDMSSASCLLDFSEKVLTLTLGNILILCLLVGSVMYRYRWHIRYIIYLLRYSHRQEVDHGTYDYDAFVAYSSEDRSWVIKTLLPVMETRDQLKLCVHDRDFEVGNLIVDNIVDGIEKSRKVIIVLSNSFARSDWCQFELNLIQRHILENGQRLLVLVILEEIESRYVTKAMRVMLQSTTFLLWGEEEYARKAFFSRLRMMLHKPSGKGRMRRLSV